MKYEIKTYQESFLEDQYNVGKEAIKEWKFEAQTPVKSLRETYSQSGFDPTTRLYAFKDDEMVGYVLTRILGEIDGIIKADLSYPRVLEGYEDAFDQLYQKAIEELKKRNVKVVRSIASKQWPKTIEAFEKLGFTYASEVYRIFNLEVNKFILDDKLDLTGISEYNHDKDKEDTVEFFVKKRGLEKERALRVLDIMTNVYPEEIFAHILMHKDKEIVARAVCTRLSDITGNFYFTGDEKYLEKPIITKMISVLKKQGIESANAFLTKNTLNQEEGHLKIGFVNCGEVSRYEKEI